MTTIPHLTTYSCVLLGLILMNVLATFMANIIRAKNDRLPVPYRVPWGGMLAATAGYWGAWLFTSGVLKL